jgi:protein phosphatase
LLEDRTQAQVIRTQAGLVIALAVVADGIGGENAGERAAELTVSTVFEHCVSSRERNIPRLLEAALEEANQRVHSEARKSRRKTNMGSTAAIAAISDHRLYVASAGDSRVYLLRGRKAFPLTVDHTWENEVVQAGRLSSVEAAKHPRRGEIVRSVGYEPDLVVDLGLWLRGGQETAAEARAAQGLPLKPGDAVLVCSDGLVKSRHDRVVGHYVEAYEFAALVRGRPPKSAVDALIKRALARQADDNVSAAVLLVPGGIYLRRYLAPAGGAAAALATLAVAAVWAAPKLATSLAGPPARPTIPALPSGVAFVSEIGGRGELLKSGQPAEALLEEQLVAAGAGVDLRSVGAGSYVRLGLADQSIVYLGPDSQLELVQIGGGGTRLALSSGIVLIARPAGTGQHTQVSVPSGASGLLSGSLMGVIWDALAGDLAVDCFSGPCAVVFPEAGTIQISSGERLGISRSGEILGPGSIPHEHYAFANYAGGLVATPTAGAPGASGGQPTPTRTPLGPLFVTPTPLPSPRPTRTPEPPPAPPPPPPPTSTPIPPSATPQLPTETPEPPPPTDEPTPPDPTEE